MFVPSALQGQNKEQLKGWPCAAPPALPSPAVLGDALRQGSEQSTALVPASLGELAAERGALSTPGVSPPAELGLGREDGTQAQLSCHQAELPSPALHRPTQDVLQDTGGADFLLDITSIGHSAKNGSDQTPGE